MEEFTGNVNIEEAEQRFKDTEKYYTNNKHCSYSVNKRFMIIDTGKLPLTCLKGIYKADFTDNVKGDSSHYKIKTIDLESKAKHYSFNPYKSWL